MTTTRKLVIALLAAYDHRRHATHGAARREGHGTPSRRPAPADADSDAPFFNGIVRVGQFVGAMDAIERQGEFSATIERAE